MATVTLEAPSLFVMIPQVKRQGRRELLDAPTRTTSTHVEQVAKAEPAVEVEAREDLADDQLISAICDGAEWAMELLYQRHSRYAYALAYRILHDPSAAEDIVQEAFLSVWRKASSYQKQHGSVHSWISAIVHHRAIDKLRTVAYREQQWTKGPYSTENEPDPASEQPDVWEQAWHSEQQRAIRSVLDQLPAEQRLVIEQAYFGGYTHAEIAEQWHIPLGTVKGRMRLGLQKMKHLLEERGIDAL